MSGSLLTVEEITFDKAKKIGSGVFSDVYDGTFEGQPVAVKRVFKIERKIERNSLLTDRETEALKKLKHPNVVKLLYVEQDDDFMYYALELCNLSMDKLFDLKNDDKTYEGLTLPPKLKVLLQLASGLAYIHSQNAVYRDIKPENVLISTKSSSINDCHIVTFKWADFGLSKSSVTGRSTHSRSSIKGTPNWMAPELQNMLIASNEADRGSLKSDVYSEGLVFVFYLLGGRCIQIETSNTPVIKKQIRFDEIEPHQMRTIVADMLKKDQNKRLTSTDVVEKIKLVIKEKKCEIKEILQVESTDIETIKRCLNDCLSTKYLNNTLMPIVLQKAQQVAYSFENLCKIISSLARPGINFNWNDGYGENILIVLCRKYNNENLFDIIRVLVENGIDVNCENKGGWNALLNLCLNYRNENLIKIIRLLVEKGADVNFKTEIGVNALSLTCKYYSNNNLIEIVRFLIEKGIDINSKDAYGNNALDSLRNNGAIDEYLETEITGLLTENGITDRRNAELLISQNVF